MLRLVQTRCISRRGHEGADPRKVFRVASICFVRGAFGIHAGRDARRKGNGGIRLRQRDAVLVDDRAGSGARGKLCLSARTSSILSRSGAEVKNVRLERGPRSSGSVQSRRIGIASSVSRLSGRRRMSRALPQRSARAGSHKGQYDSCVTAIFSRSRRRIQAGRRGRRRTGWRISLPPFRK